MPLSLIKTNSIAAGNITSALITSVANTAITGTIIGTQLGDGIVGQDISHLIPYLRLPKTNGIVIRGEFIIPKALFDSKYKSKFANPRNFVAGLINLKTINEAIKDIHFVAYEVIKPELKPSTQMELLNKLN